MWDIYLNEMYMYMSILHSSFIPTSVESFNMLNWGFFKKEKNIDRNVTIHMVFVHVKFSRFSMHDFT